MDAVVVDDHLFFIGSGKLYIADIANPASPQVIAECPFRGQGRQLAVDNGIAYVTARADGVYIIDVHDPQKPKMLCHYDCIELATGVEVQGDLLFIAQRQYGVEIVNIADPRKPLYVCKIKTGEAQSVDVRGDTIYAGDWGVSKLTTIDISNPYKPEIIESHDLDGYGDGVCVAGGYLYASTGTPFKTPGGLSRRRGPGYGAGHGLEVFSLEDPRKPTFLGRTKFPKFYHRGGHDMWTPVAAGDVVCCADTFNGVFLVDVKEPQTPRTVRALSRVGRGCRHRRRFRLRGLSRDRPEGPRGTCPGESSETRKGPADLRAGPSATGCKRPSRLPARWTGLVRRLLR